MNAAKSSLLGGGGVDGAIHKGAGPELKEYCKKLGGCSPGNAIITPGFNLQAKYIIHAVGPFYTDGKSGEIDTLRSTYQAALSTANENAIESISFPSISTGHYNFPINIAAEIATKSVVEHLSGDTTLKLIKFVLFGGDYEKIYIDFINKHLGKTVEN